MNAIKNFFDRVKKDKDFRFDFIIGIWSAIIIILIIAALIIGLQFLLKDDDSEEAASETPVPTTEADYMQDSSPIPDVEDEEEYKGSINEDLDEDIEFEDDSSSGLLYATTSVNVRSNPDTTSSVLGKLAQGESVEKVEETDNGWVKVIYNGSEAYVKSEYLTATEPGASTYVAPTMPPQQSRVTSTPKTSDNKATAKPKKTKKPKTTKKPKVTTEPEDTSHETNSSDNNQNDNPIITMEPITPAPIEPTAAPVSEPTAAPAGNENTENVQQ